MRECTNEFPTHSFIGALLGSMSPKSVLSFSNAGRGSGLVSRSACMSSVGQ